MIHNASNNKKATAVNKKLFLETLELTLGIVDQAARQCGVHRTTHYLWLKNDPIYAAAVEEIQNVQLDFVEEQLLFNIRAHDTSAILFYMKYKGRSRGYKNMIEQDITIVDKTVKFNFTNLDEDELDSENE